VREIKIVDEEGKKLEEGKEFFNLKTVCSWFLSAIINCTIYGSVNRKIVF